MSQVADQIGRVLGGRYRLVRLGGTGSSAHVYGAEDSRLGRSVAVKLLHPGLAADPTFLKRFSAEAKAAAALNHPNIVRVFDWGEDGAGPFLVLEYMGGGNLSAMLDRREKLSIPQVAAIALQAAKALEYAHRRGLVHRDIKPANILFDEEGRAAIADFGLARALAEAAWTEPDGSLFGTARYTSPEQALGQSAEGRSDVYSLGIVIYESLLGRTPFGGDSTVSMVMSRVGAFVEVPEETGELRQIISQCLESALDRRVDSSRLVG
ncbi:MAG TPA: protein kinase, partial [Acidimicrobiales bacterium]|nr:protein kinase [Acidimicrobiales bacterium]